MRCAISLLVGIFCLPAIAIVHVVSPVITSSSPITTGKVIRPSQGETVTAGEAYTVSWSPPPVSGPIDIELWDDHNKNFNAADLTGNLTPNTTCDGWVINGDCGKIAKNLLSESTSYVWYIPDLIDNEADSVAGDEFASFWLGVYIGGLASGYLPTVDSPWYLRSSNFTVEVMGKSSSTDILAFTTSSTSMSFPSPTSTPSTTSAQSTTSSSTPTKGTATASVTGSVPATSSGATMPIMGQSGRNLALGVAGFVRVLLV